MFLIYSQSVPYLNTKQFAINSLTADVQSLLTECPSESPSTLYNTCEGVNNKYVRRKEDNRKRS